VFGCTIINIFSIPFLDPACFSVSACLSPQLHADYYRLLYRLWPSRVCSPHAGECFNKTGRSKTVTTAWHQTCYKKYRGKATARGSGIERSDVLLSKLNVVDV